MPVVHRHPLHWPPNAWVRSGAGALAASFACLLIVELVLPHRNWEQLGPMGLDRSSATTPRPVAGHDR
jgi:hypothetical protein